MVGPATSSLQPSPAQERFWMLQQLGDAADTAQTVPLCVRFDGPLDADRLAAALRAVVDRHEVLRTVYRWRGERLACELLPHDAIAIATSAVADASDADALAAARELVTRPFELERGPLVRIALRAVGSERAYLILAAHHIVWDGWSNGVLLRELDVAYADGANALPSLPLSYWDYAAQTRQAIDGPRGARELSHWGERLAGLRALPSLARGENAGDADVPELHNARMPLDPELVRAVDAFARARHATRFSVFAAALGALFPRLGLGEETCLGVVLADRSIAGSEQLIGCCLNTVLLRGRSTPARSFEQLVADTSAATYDALAHAATPFELLVQRLGLARDLVHAPLHQALFTFQDLPQATFARSGLSTTNLPVPPLPGGTDPILTVVLEGRRPELGVSWNGELVVPADELLSGWRTLLECGVARPDALPGAAAPRGDEPALAGEPATVSDLLRARAHGWLHEPATIDADGELTFARLLERVDALVDRLREAGVGTGMAVGLATSRSAAEAIAMLGIQAAGAACVPLDPTYPAERLRFMLSDSAAALVLCDDPDDGTWCGVPARALDGSGTARAQPARPHVDERVAWIYYTSGTTGRPKGVLVTHRAVVARLQCDPLPWQPGDRGVHKSSPGYGDSVWELFAPLVHGRPVVIADGDAGHDPRLLARLVEQHEVTHMLLVPSLLAALLDLPEADRPRLAGLRWCIATGEPLSGALAERFYDQLPAATLVNVYGAMECWEVCWHVVPRSVRGADTVPAGSRLFDGVETWIVDDELRPVADGTPGELLVGGQGVACGYLDRPELTAARFVAPPASAAVGGHAYRTGDQAVRRADGVLELLGRRDVQVKLRGMRIELEEVERWLAASPDVVTGAVAPRRDETGTVVGLTAFLVSAHDTQPDVARVRTMLAEQLPSAWVPSAWVRLGRLPLSVNGKLDRAALELLASCAPQPLDPRAQTTEDGAPRSDREQVLVEIWRQVLDVERVDVTDDFFALGGGSLLAVQVVIRVQNALGAEIRLRDFYREPTIAGLLASLDG
jgi:amino acid adenylation domain-containing protein